MIHSKSCTGPAQAFEHVFDTVHRSVTNGGTFINNEWVLLHKFPAEVPQHGAILLLIPCQTTIFATAFAGTSMCSSSPCSIE
jgi:hypothetical protein